MILLINFLCSYYFEGYLKDLLEKDLLNKNSDEQVIYCKLKAGNDWNALSGQYKYGRLVYRTTYPMQITNPKTDELVNVIRSKYSPYAIDKPFTFDEFKGWDLVPFK